METIGAVVVDTGAEIVEGGPAIEVVGARVGTGAGAAVVPFIVVPFIVVVVVVVVVNVTGHGTGASIKVLLLFSIAPPF